MLMTVQSFQIIALLVRYHRKKFPKSDVLEGSSKEVSKCLYLKSIIFWFCDIDYCFFTFLNVSGKAEIQNPFCNY